MSMRVDPMAFCRKRSRGFVRTLLPVLVVGWLGASGPCVGMAATAAPEGNAEASAHAAHGRAEPSSRGSAGIEHDHGVCPHCPSAAGGAPSGAHVRCAAADDVSDSKRAFKPQPPDLKTALPVETRIAAAVPQARVETWRPALYHHVFPPSVPLNLRHCVFVI